LLSIAANVWQPDFRAGFETTNSQPSTKLKLKIQIFVYHIRPLEIQTAVSGCPTFYSWVYSKSLSQLKGKRRKENILSESLGFQKDEYLFRHHFLQAKRLSILAQNL